MEGTLFEVRVESVSRFVLTRKDQGWTREFPSLLAALTFVHNEPRTAGGQLIVLDKSGRVQMTIQL